MALPSDTPEVSSRRSLKRGASKRASIDTPAAKKARLSTSGPTVTASSTAEPSTPVSTPRAETQDPEPAPELPKLPFRVYDSRPLPTLPKRQATQLSDAEYQDLAASGVVGASLHRSRSRWISGSLFEKYWVKPETGKHAKPPPPNNPEAKWMKHKGPCRIRVEPHVLEAEIYLEEKAKVPLPPKQYQSAAAPNAFAQPFRQQPQAPQFVPRPSQSNVPLPGGPYQNKTQPRLVAGQQPGPNQQRPPFPPQSRSQITPAPTPQDKKPSPDPVISMLAARASSDPELKALMKEVATGNASPEQLKIFQRHIDELTAIIQKQKREEEAQQRLQSGQHSHWANGPAANAATLRQSVSGGAQGQVQPGQLPVQGPSLSVHKTQLSQGQTMPATLPPSQSAPGQAIAGQSQPAQVQQPFPAGHNGTPAQPQPSPGHTTTAPPPQALAQGQLQQANPPSAGQQQQQIRPLTQPLSAAQPPTQQSQPSGPGSTSQTPSEQVTPQDRQGAQNLMPIQNQSPASATPQHHAQPQIQAQVQAQAPTQAPTHPQPTPQPPQLQPASPFPAQGTASQFQPQPAPRSNLPIEQQHRYQPNPAPRPQYAPPKPWVPPPPPSLPVIIAFTTVGASEDRFLFPQYSILEALSPQHTLASFIVTRKGRDAVDKAGLDLDTDYWQPVTMMVEVAYGREELLNSIRRWVKPAEEVRKHMEDIMARCTRAPEAFLALRLPFRDSDLAEVEDPAWLKEATPNGDEKLEKKRRVSGKYTKKDKSASQAATQVTTNGIAKPSDGAQPPDGVKTADGSVSVHPAEPGVDAAPATNTPAEDKPRANGVEGTSTAMQVDGAKPNAGTSTATSATAQPISDQNGPPVVKSPATSTVAMSNTGEQGAPPASATESTVEDSKTVKKTVRISDEVPQ